MSMSEVDEIVDVNEQGTRLSGSVSEVVEIVDVNEQGT